MNKWLILSISFVILIGCQKISALSPTSTPLPGWQTLTSDLLIKGNSFPDGWSLQRNWPDGSLTDPTINHVVRSWYDGHSGGSDQSIWRAYSLEDARTWYIEVVEKYTGLGVTPNAFTTLEPLVTPAEIKFSSQIADEFIFLCGTVDRPICEVVARYRNYVVLLEADWKRVEIDGKETSGLTIEEFELLVIEMDTVFIEFFAEFPSP